MKRKVVGFMLMAMMVVSMGTTVSAAETQDRGAELIQMEEEAQELDGFTGQAYVDLNTLGVNTQTVNPGGTFTVDAQHPMQWMSYSITVIQGQTVLRKLISQNRKIR